MKKIKIYVLISLFFFVMNACDDKSKKQQIQNSSPKVMLESQYANLKNDLLALRKEIADAPEPVSDPEKLAAMSKEDRMAMQDLQSSYRVKKDMISHQVMIMIEEINIQKNIALEREESKKAEEIEIVLTKILESKQETEPTQSNSQHA